MLRKDAYRVVRVQFLNVMLVVKITVARSRTTFFFKPETSQIALLPVDRTTVN